MAMLAPVQTTVKRGRGRPSADQCNPLGEINNEGYTVVATMSMQLTDLKDAADYNALEDMTRAKLASILREQERELIRLGTPARMALEQNRRAQRCLSAVDVLDAMQGLDRDQQPIKKARSRNREAHAAGRRIVQLSEPGARFGVSQSMAEAS